MHVLLINGSPHEKGCTYTALAAVAAQLEANGIQADIRWIGTQPIGGCIGCGGCRTKKACVFDDIVNELAAAAQDYDGFVFGSPVHYAAISGNMTSLMDRLFYSGGKHFRYKPAAVVVSARRAGTTAALDQISKYIALNHMPMVYGSYWPMVHGNKPEQVMKDEEGLQIMRHLARNLAWMIKSFALARENGILPPELEAERKRTNFIR